MEKKMVIISITMGNYEKRRRKRRMWKREKKRRS